MRGKIFAVTVLLFLTVVVIIGLVFWKISRPRSVDGYSLYGRFSDVGGLKMSSPIRFRGQVVGAVDSISVFPDRVDVSLRIKNSTRIPSGSFLQIGSQGLTGDPYVEIVPPSIISDSFSVLTPGSVLEGRTPVSLAELQIKSLEVLIKIDSLVRFLNERVKAIDPRAIRQTVSHLQVTSENLRLITDSLQIKGPAILDSLENLSGRINSLLGQVEDLTADTTFKTDLKNTAANLNKVSGALRKFLFWIR